MILLNPGPVNLSADVRQALSGPDLCHREPEFFELQDSIRARLLDVYGLDPRVWAAVLLGGSGTSAVEAMITSLVPREGKLFVLENGVYGERMSRIAAAHGIPSTSLRMEWGEAIDPARVRRGLEADHGVTHVAVVHHETTTGRLNRLEALAELCRDRQVSLLIDGVSSFGAEDIRFKEWGVTACAGTANKCLHGVPGLAFAVVARAALENGCRPARTLYLDLLEYCGEQDRQGTPFTPIVPAFYALKTALQEHADQGGVKARQAHYRGLAERLRTGLAVHGIEPYLPAEDSSVVLRSYRLPQGIAYDALHDELKDRGFVIYAGQNRLRELLFRISTMGEVDLQDMERLLDAFGEILRIRATRGSISR